MASLSLKWTAGCVVYKGSLALLGLRNKDTTPSGVRNTPVTYCSACCLHFNDSCFVVNHSIFLNFSYSLWSVKSSVRSISDLHLGETMVQALIHQKGAMTQVSLDEDFPWNQQLFSSTASWWLHLHLFAFVSVFIFFYFKQIEVNLFKCQGMDCSWFTKINAFV